jgi:uncharacterized protein DUF4238
VSAARHHTVASFLLSRFASKTTTGTRVCQLEKTTGAAFQVSPRDVTVLKHFYSFDIEGVRHPLLEKALARIESAAAPIIRQLCVVGDDGLAVRPGHYDLSDLERAMEQFASRRSNDPK